MEPILSAIEQLFQEKDVMDSINELIAMVDDKNKRSSCFKPDEKNSSTSDKCSSKNSDEKCGDNVKCDAEGRKVKGSNIVKGNDVDGRRKADGHPNADWRGNTDDWRGNVMKGQEVEKSDDVKGREKTRGRADEEHENIRGGGDEGLDDRDDDGVAKVKRIVSYTGSLKKKYTPR